MISLSHKFIFIHAPKCGGSSIVSVLAPYCIEKIKWAESGRETYVTKGKNDIDPHARYIDYIKNWKAEWGDVSEFTKIGCVRNPYARSVSFFYDKAFGPDNKEDLRKSFRASVERLSHFWEYYTLNEGHEHPKKWEMDFFIKLEDIQADTEKVLKHLGIPCVSIPHKNKNNKYESWRDFYKENETLIEVVGNRFKEDLDKFKYSI